MTRSSLLLILTFGLSLPALAQEGQATRPPAMLLHGNYCGPGNNAPLAPVDALDAACARHDACTPNGGLPSRSCNARLQHDADLISRDPRQADDLRVLAGLVAAGAGILPTDTRLAAAPAQSLGQVGSGPSNGRPPGSPTSDANGIDGANGE